MKTIFNLLIFLFFFTLNACHAQQPEMTKTSGKAMSQIDNTAWEIDESKMNKFLDSLLSKMSLQDKIAQTVLFSVNGDTGPTVDADYNRYLKEGTMGAVFNLHDAKNSYDFQKVAIEETPLGIPILVGYDVIHGFKTIFPIPLGESASWDMEAIEKGSRVAGEEASAAGIHWTFAPMVDIARDPRWGRISEGAGEDVYLGSQIAKARVKGFQGENLGDKNTVLACAKHYAAYGAAQAGRDYNTVDISERELRDVYLPPFMATVDAGVASFMTSFNEIAGVPSSGSKFLLNDVLRDEWKFDGFVVTDYTSMNEMISHGFSKDEKHAGEQSINAGVEMDMQGGIYMRNMEKSVKEGKVAEKRVEQAARKILEMKYRLGLFDDPYRYSDLKREKATIYKPEHLEASRDIARKSLVLLKNDKQTLPLAKDKKIALIGPLVKDEEHIIGSWAARGDRKGKAVSVFEGFEQILGSKNNISFAKGCEINTEDMSGFDEAVKTANSADVVVMVMGESEHMSGEAACRTNIDLPGVQKKLIAEIKKTGKPIVLVIMSGRPLTLEYESQTVDAMIEAWFPGTMGGIAIADVLFGDYNPSGKTPVTFPRSVGQIPIFYNAKSTGRPLSNPNHFKDYQKPKESKTSRDPFSPEPASIRSTFTTELTTDRSDKIGSQVQDYESSYYDIPNSPLYPFGFGLSYTSFEYSNLKLNKKSINFNEELSISITVKNTGNYDGEEVVQLYIRDLVGSVTRPLIELKGFEKIMLKKGESKTLTFTLSEKDLRFYNIDMNYVAEEGDFYVFVGTNSTDVLAAEFTLTK